MKTPTPIGNKKDNLFAGCLLIFVGYVVCFMLFIYICWRTINKLFDVATVTLVLWRIEIL